MTGGAGFIGSHVAEAYLAEGWEVTALDDLSSGKRENVAEGVEFVEMDIRSPELPDLLRRRRFDVVNHHAAQVDVRISVARPRDDASINVDGLLNVLEACRRSGVGRVVYVSSGGVVYGEPEDLPVEETRAKAPASPYGVSKLAGEQYLDYYRVVQSMPSVSLRYSNVYGPRQNPHGEAGVVAIFSQRAIRGRPLIVYGDGEQTRDYVYVKDVARANLVASTLELEDAGTLDDFAFNVGTGIETSVNDLVGRIIEIAGHAEVERQEARTGELLRSALDVRKLESTGWSAEYSLTEGLSETYGWVAAAEGGA
ncbi:MAG: NAD-dependent epimerase/dehydratase family protein [Gemmatimonadales bacterium]